MARWPADCGWSADSLIVGYQRCIVGLDYREWMQDRGMFPATIDDQVWSCRTIENPLSLLEEERNGLNLYQAWPPREAKKNSLLKENGFNLFRELLEMINAEQPPQNSILAAFDFPEALVNTVDYAFGIIPLPIGLLAGNGNWKFLGYDVADIRTLVNGLYGFDWTEAEFVDICSQQSLSLNSKGLIDDELLAIKTAVSFGHLVSTHAPFAPCGVWIASKETKRQLEN